MELPLTGAKKVHYQSECIKLAPSVCVIVCIRRFSQFYIFIYDMTTMYQPLINIDLSMLTLSIIFHCSGKDDKPWQRQLEEFGIYSNYKDT